MVRVVADTNVLISGLLYKRGKPHEFLRMALLGEINLAVSQPIIDEILDVLPRKFGTPVEELAEYLAVLSESARTVRPAVELDVIKEDPDDNRVLECAVAAGADCIVTGDKDLLRLGSYDSIRILSVSDFLAISQGPAR